MADAQPDVLYLPAYTATVNQVGTQARQRGLNVVMLGGDGWASPDLDLKVVEGSYYTDHYSADEPRAAVQEWVKKYEAKYDATPDTAATLGYDAATMLFTAMKNAGSADPDQVKDALAALEGFEGITGKMSMDAHHDPLKSVLVVQVKDGKVRYFSSIAPCRNLSCSTP